MSIYKNSSIIFYFILLNPENQFSIQIHICLLKIYTYTPWPAPFHNSINSKSFIANTAVTIPLPLPTIIIIKIHIINHLVMLIHFSHHYLKIINFTLTFITVFCKISLIVVVFLNSFYCFKITILFFRIWL